MLLLHALLGAVFVGDIVAMVLAYVATAKSTDDVGVFVKYVVLSLAFIVRGFYLLHILKRRRIVFLYRALYLGLGFAPLWTVVVFGDDWPPSGGLVLLLLIFVIAALQISATCVLQKQHEQRRERVVVTDFDERIDELL